MSKIKINLNNNGFTGRLEIEQVSESTTDIILEKFLSLFGSDKSLDVVTLTPAIKVNKGNVDMQSALNELGQAIQRKSEIVKEKPALINSTRTLSVSLAEKLSDKPDWYETGIKYKEGIPHYRCRCYCNNPSCDMKSTNDYIEDHVTELRCRKCGNKLRVRQATPVAMERDGFGNFFIADDLRS